MKLSTLLLSSAALVVAGSAYAADLPAKKGAPAAKAATGCPAFGAGYFQIPGSETCIKIGGYVRAQYGLKAATNSTNAMQARAQLTVDAASNSDFGAIKSTMGTDNTNSGLEWAYITAGGFTAGLKYSESDFDQGTISQQIGGSYTTNSLLYTATVGSSTVSFGLEQAVSAASTYSTFRPDLVAAVSTAVGPASLSLAGVSTAPRASDSSDGTEGQGYGVTGLIKVAAGAGSVGIYGGYAKGASRVACSGDTEDFDGTNYSKCTSVGVKASMPLGNGTVTLLAGQEALSTDAASAVTTTTTKYAARYAIAVAKGLTVSPEFGTSNNGTTTTNGGYLRIQRDF